VCTSLYAAQVQPECGDVHDGELVIAAMEPEVVAVEIVAMEVATTAAAGGACIHLRVK
jgi:hypothetical protein